MKYIFSFIILFISHTSHSDAFLSFGLTSDFKHQNDSVYQKNDSLKLISLNGINLGNTDFKDIVGFSIGYGYGEHTYNKKDFYQKSHLYSLGLNFPFYNKFYINLSGNYFTTSTHFEHNTPTKINNEKITGYQASIGTKIYDKFHVDFGYNNTLDVFTFQLGYCWHKCK